MATPSVLTFDAEGRAVDFEVWVDDLQLFLQCDRTDGLSLFDLTSGVSPAPPATADSTVRSQWATRDAATRLAVRRHLPTTERAHFSQYRSAQTLYDAVVARYSSPATASLSRLFLPYLFSDLAAFPTVADLITHLRTSDARYRTALPAEFCAKNPPPLYLTLYYVVTRLPDSLRVVRDHFLSVCPTTLTVDLLEERLLAAEQSIVAVGASRGDPRTPIFEGRSVLRLPLVGAVALAGARGAGALVGVAGAVAVVVEAVGGVGVVVGVVVVVEVLAAAVEAVAAVAAAEVAEAVEVAEAAEAVVELVAEVHRGVVPVVVSASSSSAVLRPPPLSSFVSGTLGVSECAAPHSSEFPPTEAPLQTLHMDVWGPARVRGQGHERYFLLVVDDYSRYTTVFPLRSKGEVTEVLIDWIRAARLRLRESFGSDFPVLRLHSDRGGEFSSARLGAFCRAQGIRQTFTLPASPQQNGIAERRIGMVMDVARTSMIHAVAPHFLWPFAVQYAAHQLNLQPRVSLPETSPTLLWTGKVGDASAFRVWGSRAFVRDLSADKLSPRAVPCVFLGFPPDAPGWQFYHPTSRRVLSSQDVTFDASVPYYRLFPYRTASLPPPPLFLAPGPPLPRAGETAAPGASEFAAPGAGESTPSGTASAQVFHTFTLDSGASRSFFRDRTTLTPLSRPVAVSLADPSGGHVLAIFSIVLPCPAAPSGSLTGLYLPSFSTNLVSGADLQDHGVDQFTPASHRVTHCTCARTGRYLATFTRRPGSSLYTLSTESPPVSASGQVAASSQVLAAASGSGPESAPCSCRLLSHQTLLWHHRLGHPSLPRLRGMASRVLVSGLPRSLPPLPPGAAPTCVPCVEGRQRAAPHSSEFPPTEAPLQTLHMDVWGPARVRGQGHERYFLLVVDDYSRYTTVFPLRSKGEVTEVLIDWIRAARLRLRESFGSDFPVLRLHSDRGGEFSSARLGAFCRAQGIRQTFTLPASPQQNGIAERRIGMVMDVARTSMIHAAAPHFLWPFAVQYAAHQLNLQPRVSLPETSPTLLWTGKVGDASAFQVWGSRAFVRDLSADKLSPRATPCVFLGFPPDAPGWQFYHPTSRRVLSSQDVTFDESVPYYRLFPYRTASLPPPPLFLAPSPPPVDPLPPQGPAPSGVSQVDAVEPVEVAVDSGTAPGTEPAGAGSGGAESGGAGTWSAEPWGAGTWGAAIVGKRRCGCGPRGDRRL
ncbi:unnamed protein product [Closterium sp. NIES-53]